MPNKLYKINPVVVVGVPTLLTKAPISWEWCDAYYGLAFPLGMSVTRIRIPDQYVADARNAIVEYSLKAGAEWTLFISDDVKAPSRTFEMLWRHKKHITTGVYWTKYHPSQPYIWRNGPDGNFLAGPFSDWTYGEFFKVDWAGCDCLLVNNEVFRRIERPWFSHHWNYDGQSSLPANLATEDVFFYTKARQAGFDLWCDTAVQCGHQDRETGVVFGLDENARQFKDRDQKWKLYDEGKKVADIGAGYVSPHFGDAKVFRIDGDEETKPDILCDVRSIPVETEHFDVVHARHVLEHFALCEHESILLEWLRILKVGGEMIINVPHLAYAAKMILKAEEDPEYDATYAFYQLYGRQKNVTLEEIHKCGFTTPGIKRLFERFAWCVRVDAVEYPNDGVNIQIKATKYKSSKPMGILPAWNTMNGNGKHDGPEVDRIEVEEAVLQD